MRHPIIRAVCLRELRSWFGDPTGYVFIVLFVFLSALALVLPPEFFRDNLANLDTLNGLFRFLLLIIIPAVTMGMWSRERANGTQELLFTLPATDAQILLGKYLAAAGIYTIALLFTITLPLGLEWLGDPDWGLLFANYLGYWLLGLMLISVAMVGSQLTDNVAVAFVLGFVFCGLVVTSGELAALVSPGLGKVWSVYGPHGLFLEMTRGVVSFGSIALFVTMTAAFLYLNLVLLERRNWQRAAQPAAHKSVRFAALLIGAGAATVIAVNRMPRVDATVERIHSLSEETEEVLAELDPERPVYIQAFISDDVPQEYVQTRRNLLNMLRQYDTLGGAALQVRIVPTERFTEAAREAEENFTIRAVPRTSAEGTQGRQYHIYMGLAFQCGPEEVVVPFVDRFTPVEYELTRSIRVVADTDRKVVGVLKTEVEMFGGMDFQTFRRNPAWQIVEELRLQYRVENVDPAQDYPEDLDVLIVPMVSSLAQEEMDRLAGWIRGGNPTLLIDDPFPWDAPGTSATDPKGGRRNPMMGGPPPGEKGDVAGLLAEFGLRFPVRTIVWDLANPHPALAQVEPEIVFCLGGDLGGGLNPNDPVTSGLQEVVALVPGHVLSTGRESLQFEPLVQTSTLSGTVPKEQFVTQDFFGMGQPFNPNRRPRQDMDRHTIAARVTGRLSEDAEKPIELAFLADLDMISSMFFEMRRRGFIEDVRFDNVTFILNCIDDLAGDTRFLELRKRRPEHRTLTTIEEQQEQFEREWLEQKEEAEKRAEEELDAAQARLDEAVALVREDPNLDRRAKEGQIRAIQEKEQRRLDLAKAQIEDEKAKRLDEAMTERRQGERTIRNYYTVWTLILSVLPAVAVGLFVFFRRRMRETAIIPTSRVAHPAGGAA